MKTNKLFMQTLEKQPVTVPIQKSKTPDPKNRFWIVMSWLIGISLVFLIGVVIYNAEGEVWKYGYTINGQKGRYSQKFLDIMNLRYEMQFMGNIGACMAEEKIKIFHYPTLPENLKRQIKLLRPPGNKEDR